MIKLRYKLAFVAIVILGTLVGIGFVLIDSAYALVTGKLDQLFDLQNNE